MDPSSPAPTPRDKKKSWTIIIIIIVSAIALTVGFAMLASGQDGDSNDTKQKQSQFKNWLKPSGEIKVGNHRYVSSCQILPKDALTAAFGGLDGKTIIQENYLDQSVKESSLPLDLNCVYNPVTSNGAEIRIETEQYTDMGDAKRIGSSFGSFDDEEVQKELDAYTKALSAKPNKGASDFLNKLKQSFSTYKKYQSLFSDEIPTKDLNDLVLPISDSISGALTSFAFVGAHNNVVYTLGYSPSSEKKAPSSVAEYSDQKLVDTLLAYKQATETIHKNLQNTSLDQSPAPTILGNTDKYGSTAILEPCAIMTPSVFSQINGGKPQSKPVDRETVSIDITTKYYTRDKRLILPQNQCQREAEDEAENSTYATFSLEYGSSANQAQQWLNQNYTLGSDDTQLQTNADWAGSFANPLKSDGPRLIVFRVGPYIGHIDMYSKTTAGETAPTQDQYVQAINTLVPELKQAISEAR